MGGIIPHQEIIRRNRETALFDVFSETKQVVNGKSWGVSQAGYDVRIAQDVTLYPVTLPSLALELFGIRRDSFKLASTVEYFYMPNDLIARVADKSTWARLGLAVQNTVIEPGWQGYLTLELTNHSRDVIRIQKGEPIAQIIFEQLTEATEQPYSGKYQYQENRPVDAILEK